jgi:hypothetical protein
VAADGRACSLGEPVSAQSSIPFTAALKLLFHRFPRRRGPRQEGENLLLGGSLSSSARNPRSTA